MTRHQHSCGRVHDCDAAVPPRPAAGDPDFPYMLADTREEFERVRGIGIPATPDDEERPGYVRAGAYWVPVEPLNIPAAPDAAAGDGLREAIAEALRLWDGDPDYPISYYLPLADAVLAMPALRDVLAAAARDAELRKKVRVITAYAEQWEERGGHPAVRGFQTPAMRHVIRDLRTALLADGTL